MRKKSLSISLSLILLLCVALPTNATSISNVKKEKENTEKNLESVNSSIDSINNQKQELETQVSEMDQQLVDILTSISICKDEIEAKEIQIGQAKEDLEEAKLNEEEQYEAMKTRIKFMYEQGNSAYLQLFLESANISDMLNKANYVEKLYEYDRTLLDDYQSQKDAVIDLKKTLEEEEAELLAANHSLEDEQNSLESLIAQKRATITDFDSRLDDARNKVESYKSQLREQTAQLKKLEEEERKKEEEKKKREKENPSPQTNAPGSNTGDTSDQSGGSNDDGSSTDKNKGKENQPASSGNASLGQQIASYACQFVGNPYVYGGTSLTNGADCSGFTMSVFKNFGISLPRDSTSQRGVGRAVSLSEAQPGDLVCYAGHVAIYIGNGQIVHASTAATGIKYSSVTYRTIICVRRVV